MDSSCVLPAGSSPKQRDTGADAALQEPAKQKRCFTGCHEKSEIMWLIVAAARKFDFASLAVMDMDCTNTQSFSNLCAQQSGTDATDGDK